eukprot:COSAG03_NODE_20241_length_322_cov_1.139013_1_plen_53_part_10
MVDALRHTRPATRAARARAWIIPAATLSDCSRGGLVVLGASDEAGIAPRPFEL